YLVCAAFLKDDSRPGRLIPVRIDSNPPGATVSIDGERHERPTGGEFPLAPGRYVLLLEKPGFEPRSETLDVREGMPGLTFDLQPLGGKADPTLAAPVKVTIETDPPGAKIYLGGVPQTNPTPADLSLAPGKYALRLKRVGYKELNKEFEVPKGGKAFKL